MYAKKEASLKRKKQRKKRKKKNQSRDKVAVFGQKQSCNLIIFAIEYIE